VPTSACQLYWCGALSGRGHGRFWLARVNGRDVAVIAHRFAFGLEHGADALLATRVLGHRCDNPLSQRVDEQHVRASSPLLNRREWAARRRVGGAILIDRRGARGRARALRAEILAGGAQLELVDQIGRPPGTQMPLWGAEPTGASACGGPGAERDATHRDSGGYRSH
jgi:hypothetical protein